MSRLSILIAKLAALLLPTGSGEWGRAMVAETRSVEPGSAARFALGCLAAALAARSSNLMDGRGRAMILDLGRRPRQLAILCAGGAILLGFAYMAAAGAPVRFFAVNAGAFLLGLLALAALNGARLAPAVSGLFAVAMAGMLLAVSLVGVSADGVTRWIPVAGVLIQPSLLLVPVLVLGFLRFRHVLWALALAVAALALALQPDRSMAGALVAGLAVVAAGRRGWLEFAALGAAAAALAATLLRGDPSAAVPFVDQILFTSFGVHPAAGLAVWAGSALIILPAIVGFRRDPENRPTYAVFGAIWITVVAAAALGNSPTPLVGYSGSAILGYLVSIVALPPRRSVDRAAGTGASLPRDREGEALRAALA